MPLPLLGLGAAARLLLAQGSRKAAVKKYGKRAVKKGQEQIKKIKKGSAAIDKDDLRLAAALLGLGALSVNPYKPKPFEKQRKQKLEEQRYRKLADERLRRQLAKSDVDPEGDLIPEAPRKFARGGSIDGRAKTGLTKGSRRI